MHAHRSLSRTLFVWVNSIVLIGLALTCLIPLVHVLAVSLSSNSAATVGRVHLWPVEFNMLSYQYVLTKKEFLQAMLISVQRVLLGTGINLVLTIMIAYPLSKEVAVFRSRTVYAWFFVLTMLFSGGLIPWYMVISATGIMDSIWALILPGAVPVFSVVLLLNFFRGLPKELEEAAFIDGAGYVKTLALIMVPLSKPALATIGLLAVVGHWNAWFDGLILMNTPKNYPLQSYLQTVIIQQDFTRITEVDLEYLSQISDRTVRAAQIFIGAFPVLCVYPFLQKYFMKGIVLGSVKG